MEDYLKRHIALQEALGNKTFRSGDIIFRQYNQIIIPLGPVIQQKPKNWPSLKEVLKHLKGKLVWWSFHDDGYVDEVGWYAVIKDKHYEVDEYPSANTRNQIRKALKNCNVKQIEASWLAENGLEIMEKVMHKMSLKPTEKAKSAFKNKCRIAAQFADIIHYYGIFSNEKLIGFCEVYFYSGVEANISQIRINQEYKDLYPVYALIHVLSAEYLKNGRIKYLSDGYRNLLHDTNVQEFLIRKFSFKKFALLINLQVRFPFNIMLFCFRFPIKLIRKSNNSLTALFKLIEIVKIQTKKG